MSFHKHHNTRAYLYEYRLLLQEDSPNELFIFI
jgi:hypothetical protein